MPQCRQGGRAGLSPALGSAKWVQPNINYSAKESKEPVHIDPAYLPGLCFCGGHKLSWSLLQKQTLSEA